MKIHLIIPTNKTRHSSVFTLNLLQEYGEVEVRVTNISGQSILIKSFRNPNRRLKIDLSRYPTGMYIVNTMADGKTLPVKKAIVGCDNSI